MNTLRSFYILKERLSLSLLKRAWKLIIKVTTPTSTRASDHALPKSVTPIPLIYPEILMIGPCRLRWLGVLRRDR